MNFYIEKKKIAEFLIINGLDLVDFVVGLWRIRKGNY